jgi:hypothetical protein
MEIAGSRFVLAKSAIGREDASMSGGREDNDRVDARALGSSEGLVEILRLPNLKNLEP